MSDLVTLQEIYFDLIDLKALIDGREIKNISLRGKFDLDVYETLREFLVEQIEKLEPLTVGESE